MNLQCPARLHLVPPEHVHGAVEELRGERIAAVYRPDSTAAAGPATEVARLLDVPLRTLQGLAGGPGATGAVETIADLHRGENVVVVCPASLLRAVAERALGHLAEGAEWTVLECGDEGWRLVGRP